MRLLSSSSFLLAAIVTTGAALAACASNDGTEGVGRDESSLTGQDRAAAAQACQDVDNFMKAATVASDNGSDGDAFDTKDDSAEKRGRKAFNDRQLHDFASNGRACADCHMASTSFALSREVATKRVEALFKCRTLQPEKDDPFVRPLDANPGTDGTQEAHYANLKRGVVSVQIPLLRRELAGTVPGVKIYVANPDNSDSNATHATVWRAVPSINDVAITGADDVGKTGDTGGVTNLGPNPKGGYQLDGRIATLELQAKGALVGHAEIPEASIADDAPFLSDIAAFEKSQFSSPYAASVAAALLSNSAVPAETVGADVAAGKAIFQRACAHCHGTENGAGGANWNSTGTPNFGERYKRIRNQCPRPGSPPGTPARFTYREGLDPYPDTGETALPPCGSEIAIQTFNVYTTVNSPTGPVTTKTQVKADDLGRAFFTGRMTGPTNDVGSFDNTNLRGIGRTAPYFHNNSAATLEDVVEHYRRFFNAVRRENNSPTAVLPGLISTDGTHFDRFLAPEDSAPLVAYLKTL